MRRQLWRRRRWPRSNGYHGGSAVWLCTGRSMRSLGGRYNVASMVGRGMEHDGSWRFRYSIFSNGTTLYCIAKLLRVGHLQVGAAYLGYRSRVRYPPQRTEKDRSSTSRTIPWRQGCASRGVYKRNGLCDRVIECFSAVPS